MLLKRVIIEIEDQTEAQALEEQISLLEEAGITVDRDETLQYGSGAAQKYEKCAAVSISVGNAEGFGPVLIFTDDPDAARSKYGLDSCILLYLTEKNQGKWWKNVPYAVISVRGLTPEFLEQVYRRYIGAPWDILETERLRIREMTENDLEDLYRIYDQPGIEEFVDPLEESKEKQREILRSYIRKIYPVFGFGMWMVIEKESGQCIGRVGLQMESRALSDDNAELSHCPELGFIMGKAAQRKGYCLEACRAVLRYGFEELDMEEICAVVAEKNLPSRELCTRLGGRLKMRDGQCLFYWSKIDAAAEE